MDVPDTRFPANLPNGPYQITKYVAYLNAFVGDPLHRYYQMAQQIGRNSNKLWTWVHQTAGDDNGVVPPKPIFQGARDGLLQRPTGRRAGAEVPRRSLRDVRQLSSSSAGRHRC